ncbi:MAG: YraN family protein [Treponema sp.]|nr:YraN family protein [Treponema sp.]
MHKALTDRRISVKNSQGRKGEDHAAAALEAVGMEIITRNFRSKYGEIDIVALDNEIVVFVEVKTWSVFGLEDLQYSINVKKQIKIIKTAKYFLSENRKYNKMAIRFDVVYVKINKPLSGCQMPTERQTPDECQITHLASAFTERV